MNFDGSDFQYVIALDKLSGKTVWKTDRSIDFKDLTREGKVSADGDWRKADRDSPTRVALSHP